MSNVMNLNSSTSTPHQAWVEKLLTYMLACYGKRFTDQWCMVQQRDIIDVWADELQDMSHAELKRGKEALASREWPPTLPEFKKLCRPSVEPMKAYYEAMAGVTARFAGEYGEWSHPAIYWAAMPMATELREQTFSQVKARWEAALDKQLAKGAWEELPQPMLAIAALGKALTSREEASKRLRELGATTVVKAGQVGDKRWARILLEREAAGEAFSSPIIPRFAREALAAQ